MVSAANSRQPGPRGAFRRLDSAAAAAALWAARLGGVLILAVGLFVFYEVIRRHVFHSPTLWVMDYAIYCVMWAVFLGAAHTLRTGGHVMVDVVIEKLPAALRRPAGVGVHALMLGFCATAAAAGVHSCIRAWQMKELTLSALFIPLYYPMSAIPVGFALMALQEAATLGRLLGDGDGGGGPP